MITAYIALGSNLNTPVEQLHAALKAISQLPNTHLVTTSSFYKSKPLGPQDQPDYVNAVAKIKTELSPLALLDELQRIENEQGRVRLRRWGERTLDLDILLYGNEIIQNERLQFLIMICITESLSSCRYLKSHRIWSYLTLNY